MKRLSVLLALLVSLLYIALPAFAANDVNGVKYRVNITMPAGHDHIYLYDQPSSSNGKNLGRIDNGEYVIGISSVERKGYTWIYCNYNGIEGYIRKNNLVKVSSGSSSSGTSSVSGNSSSNRSSNSNNGTVSFSGDVNVRTGPGLGYEVIGSVSKGQTLTYAGETRKDDRGVAWYSVNYKGQRGWVSSRYSSLNGASSSTKNWSDSLSTGNHYVEEKNTGNNYIEVSQYYLTELSSAADKLGLNTFYVTHSEAPNTYTDGKLTIGGNDIVEYFGLDGTGYKVFGVYIGMKKQKAKDLMLSAGMKFYDDRNQELSFEHPSSNRSIYDSEGYDSIIYVEIEGGIVSGISWSSYTG